MKCVYICVTDDPCGNEPCGDDQTCVVTSTGFVCECKMGYQGDCNNCEGEFVANRNSD